LRGKGDEGTNASTPAWSTAAADDRRPPVQRYFARIGRNSLIVFAGQSLRSVRMEFFKA
jgi:hypothetical protein